MGGAAGRLSKDNDNTAHQPDQHAKITHQLQGQSDFEEGVEQCDGGKHEKHLAGEAEKQGHDQPMFKGVVLPMAFGQIINQRPEVKRGGDKQFDARQGQRGRGFALSYQYKQQQVDQREAENEDK